MKSYHFALAFCVIAIGFMVSAQTILVKRMREEHIKRTEYDCLVAAVDATVDVVFTGRGDTVTEARLLQAEEVFFQTLAVLHEGITDRATWEGWRQYVPCLVVFATNGYYRYSYEPEKGYQWSKLLSYNVGELPEQFFSETANLLQEYHGKRLRSSKKYRVEKAEKGVWEQSIMPPCVFAVYAPCMSPGTEEDGEFLYAASGRSVDVFYVTEDGCCHLAFCERCKNGKIVARYSSQKESAKAGAMPCEYCLK